MYSSSTLISPGDEKIAKKILSFLINLILLFIPSSLIAFLGIKSSLLGNLFITFIPSVLFCFSMLVRIVYRYFFIKKNIDMVFKKCGKLQGKGFYFLELTKFLKKYNEDNPNKYKDLILKDSTFLSEISIKYSVFNNSLEINTDNNSYKQNSSTSNTIFSYLEFDSKNRKNFTIIYTFKNNAHNYADLNSKEINDLKSFEGYAKITVYNLEIKNFYYVSDFVNRYSFGTYDITTLKKER